jgi:hypothetical protein
MLVRPGAPSPDPLPWPSPIVEQFTNCSPRVRVLNVLGELLDDQLLTEGEVGGLMEAALRGDKEVMEISDIIDSRSCSNGKAQFLRIFLSLLKSSSIGGGYTTPAPFIFPHATPFVEFPSHLIRSASPVASLRCPMALRPSASREGEPPPVARTQSSQGDEVDPKMSPSTNVGSSMETSAIEEAAINQNCTVCRDDE